MFLLGKDPFDACLFTGLRHRLPILPAFTQRHKLCLAVFQKDTVLEMDRIHPAFIAFQHSFIGDCGPKSAVHTEGELHIRRHLPHQTLIYRDTVHQAEIRADGMERKNQPGLRDQLIDTVQLDGKSIEFLH